MHLDAQRPTPGELTVRYFSWCGGSVARELARAENEGMDQIEIERVKATLTWYEASLRRLISEN
jgi:hypothetical protein